MLKGMYLFFFLLIISINCFSAAINPSELTNDQFQAIAERAYIFAYPLVLMGVTKESMTNVPSPRGGSDPRAPVNQFVHVFTFPSPEIKHVVRPNADTLYSSAWLNLAREPQVLTLPNANNRYYLMPMMDAWTDVFTSPGKRTIGTKEKTFILVGPHWQGNIPTGMTKIQAPTNLVWIIGRTQTNGKVDYENVHQFQEGIKLVPLHAYKNKDYQPDLALIDTTTDMQTPPAQQVQEMDIGSFFKKFLQLIKNNPPHPSDQAMMDELKLINIIPGQDFDPSQLTSEQIGAFNHAKKLAEEKIAQAANSQTSIMNGWSIKTKNMGTYGNDYLQRAAVARFTLGANLPEDGIYPATSVDNQGTPLNGQNNYKIHFNKENLPPVNAFWSLTLYDKDGYFVENKLDRYTIGDRDKLVYNADGSLDLYIQNEAPGNNKAANWLPAPTDEFNLLLRLYWPKSAAIEGKWTPPGIEKTA